MAGFGNVPTQLGKAIKAPGPKPPAPWHAGSGTTLARNIPQGASFTQTSAATAPAKPQTTPAPTPPKASATTTAPPQSPLDSTYYANIAANNLRVGNQINSLTAQGQNSATNLQDALGQLAYQQPRAQLASEEAANRRGALYSSVEGQQQGDILNQYSTKSSALTRADGLRQAAIASQIKGLQDAQPLYANQQYDAAVARAIKAALANPATGQAPISTPPPAPARGGPVVKSLPGKKGTVGATLTGLKAAKPPVFKVGQGIPKVKSGFGYRGGF